MGRGPRLHLVLGDGPSDPDRQCRRAGRAVHGGLDDPDGARRGDPAHPPRDAGLLGPLPQSHAAGEDGRRRRPDQPRPPHLRHRRRLVRDGVPAIRLGVPAATGGAHPADGRSHAADPRIVDREADDVPGQVLPGRGRHPRAQAGAEAASAGHDRRRRRATDAARGRAAGRCLQRRRHARHGAAQVRGAAPPLRGRASQLRRDRADQRHQLRAGARRGRAGRQAPRPGGTRPVLRLRRHGVAGHRPGRPVPRRRRAAPHQQRLQERRRNARTAGGRRDAGDLPARTT